MADFYVYLIRRLDGRPCYVGKGRGRRFRRHARRSTNPHLASIYAKADSPLPIEMIGEGLTESEAFALEKTTIAAIGREPVGPLVNMTDGGEGPSGFRFSTESKAKMSKSASGNKYCLGRVLSIETKQKMRAAKKGRPLRDGHRKAIGAAHVGQKRSAETCSRISAAKTGKKASEKTKAALRAANRSRDPEVRARISEAVQMAAFTRNRAGNTQWV